MKKKYEGKDFKALEKEGNIKDEAKLEFLSSNGHSAPSRSVYNDTNI